MLQAEYIVKNI